MSVSAHGDRKHCSSITTARRKKHLFHLTKRVCRPFDTTCCARAIGRAKSRAFSGTPCAKQRAIFSKCSKPRFHKGFCDIINKTKTSLQAVERRASSTAEALPKRSGRTESPVKKNMEKVRRGAPRFPGFDPNRANRLQVIRG